MVNVVTGTVILLVVSAYRLVLLVGLWKHGVKAAAVAAHVVALGVVEAAADLTGDIIEMKVGAAEAHKQCVTVCACVFVVVLTNQAVNQDNLVEFVTVLRQPLCVLVAVCQVILAVTMEEHLAT